MKKKELLNYARQHEIDLDNQISQLETEVQKYSGRLIYRQTKGRGEFYVFENGKETYLKHDDSRIAMLAQKQYLLKQLVAAKRDKKQTEKCIRDLTSGDRCSDIDEVYDNLNDAIKSFVKRTPSADEKYIDDWMKKTRLRCNRNITTDPRYKTMNGEIVKSKSEVIIADRLFMASVPYVYEAVLPMQIGSKWYVPDFPILNKRTKKTLIWEHFGKMSDPQYLLESLTKIELYQQINYHFGDNFIASFECSVLALRTDYVDAVIKHYLI